MSRWTIEDNMTFIIMLGALSRHYLLISLILVIIIKNHLLINCKFIFLFSCHSTLSAFTVLKITLLGQCILLFRRDNCDLDIEINFWTSDTDQTGEQKLNLGLSDFT